MSTAAPTEAATPRPTKKPADGWDVSPAISYLARFAKALSHVIRIDIILMLHESETPLSPSKIADAKNRSLAHVSYHVRMLYAAKLIKRVRAVPRRGAMEHFYELTAEGTRLAEAIEKMDPKDLKSVGS